MTVLSLRSFFVFCLIVMVNNTNIIAQEEVESEPDSLEYKTFVTTVRNTLEEYYHEFASTDEQTDSIIKTFGYDDKEIPSFSDSVYKQRIVKLNKTSPIHIDTNEIALARIKFFAAERRHFTSVVLGRAKRYFPMIEEKLAKHHMPLEIKYLAVIESGLRPQAESWAGALGLWQFMYRTGKYYGLTQNSYIDERMDPKLATESACRYLKRLYELYDDWFVALAAYNAGPGNVNKAIRRSGGKTTYWGIRPYLPRETQGYVPNFIAMFYLMNYHAAHNIRPREPKIHAFEMDTVCLKEGLHMGVIDSVIQWSVENIKSLNPIYKSDFIPDTDKIQCINIPTELVGKWIEFEDSIYTLDSLIYESIDTQKLEDPTFKIHYVRSGQTLGGIAVKYSTSVRKIMNWNNLRSTRLSIGQQLKIHVPGSKKEKRKNKSNDPAEIHIIKKGDNLWTIAQRKGTTVNKLKKLNPGIDYRDLKIGQKIRIQ